MCADLASRLPANPLLAPAQLRPLDPGFEVLSVINPGVCVHNGRTLLLVRVAERPLPIPGRVRIPAVRGGVRVVEDLAADDPSLDLTDPREPKLRGEGLLSSISHLRLFEVADDGQLAASEVAPWVGIGEAESYGIEDPRIAPLDDGRFLVTYTAVGPCGYGIGARITRDWVNVDHLGLILPISNKDAAVFPERHAGDYLALNRPSGVIVGGHDIWLSRSPDLIHWGRHRCLLRCRPGAWDSARIGVNGPPIRLSEGWLVLYHGADTARCYRMGAFLLDASDPDRVIARTREPIMEPRADWENSGFVGNVVFSCGHRVLGDRVRVYYGAADTVTAAADLSLADILAALATP